MHLEGSISIKRTSPRRRVLESELNLLAFLAYLQAKRGSFHAWQVTEALNEAGKSIRYKNVRKPLVGLHNAGLIEEAKPPKAKDELEGKRLHTSLVRHAKFYKLTARGWVYFWSNGGDPERIGKMISGDNEADVILNGIDALRIILFSNLQNAENSVVGSFLEPYFEKKTLEYLIDPFGQESVIHEYLRACCSHFNAFTESLQNSKDNEVYEQRIYRELRNLVFRLLFDLAHPPRPPETVRYSFEEYEERMTFRDNFPSLGMFQSSIERTMLLSETGLDNRMRLRRLRINASKRRFFAHIYYHHGIFALIMHDEKFMSLFKRLQDDITRVDKLLQNCGMKRDERVVPNKERPMNNTERKTSKSLLYSVLANRKLG